MQFLLKLLQFLTVVGVIGSNIKYGWTPNGYVAGLVALFAALLVTAVIRDSLRLLRWLAGSNGNSASISPALQRLDHEKPLGGWIVGQRSGHELISEEVLNRSGHDDAAGSGLRKSEQSRIENMKGIHPLRRS